jgi:MFS family permease
VSAAGERPDTEAPPLSQTLSLYIPALVLALGSGIIAPALPVYVKSFDIPFGVASLAIILYQVGGLAVTVPIGYLIDRIGRRPFLLGGPLVLALSSAGIAFTDSFEQLLVLRFIGGAAEQSWTLGRLVVISDTTGLRRRGRQITWMNGIGRAGNLMGPAVGGVIAGVFDIRAPFIIHGLLVFLAILPSFWLIPETNPVRKYTSGAWQMVFREIRKPQMLVFLTVQFWATISRVGFAGGMVVLYAAYTYGVGPIALGLMGTVAGVLSLPITFATGPFMDKHGRKKVIVPGFALVGVATMFLAATTVGPWPFPAFVLAYTVTLMAQATTSGSMQILGSDLAPADARGRFFAMWRIVSEGAGVAGPSLVALIAEAASFTAAFGAVAVAGLFVAALMGKMLKETVQERPRPFAAG